jgi:hypothetical protein
MSLKPGISGQPAELLDGAKVDYLREYTVGNGTQLQGRTNGVAIEQYKVGERVSAYCTTSTSTDGGVDVDVVGMTLALTKGVWLLGYNVCSAVYNNSGGTSNIYGRVRITDSANNAVSGTEAFFGADAIANLVSIYGTSSRFTTVNISADTTYKLRVAGMSTGKLAYVYGRSMVGAFTDPDNDSVIFAIRIA